MSNLVKFNSTKGVNKKRIIVVIGQHEVQKKQYLSNLEGYTIYINPENDKHPKLQREFIQNIISQGNSLEEKIAISTNSPYVLTTLNVLLYAGKLRSMMSKTEFIEIMNCINNYISPDDIEVINLDTNKSIIEDGEILAEEIDTVSDEINEQYTSLFYLENDLLQKEQ